MPLEQEIQVQRKNFVCTDQTKIKIQSCYVDYLWCVYTHRHQNYCC